MSNKGSFLEDINQMVIDAVYTDIGDQLVENWVNSNLDEGQLYADYRFAEMSGDRYIIDAFHKHWEIQPNEQYWIEL